MTQALTLYDLETDLVSLLDTEEMVSDAQRTEFEQQLTTTLKTTVAKRDRCAQFIAHCEGQQAAIAAEVQRLQSLNKSYGGAVERMKGYVLRVIQDIGPDEKGKYRKLEGHTCQFSARLCPASVDISDEAAVPESYKIVKISTSVDKRAVKDAIDSGAHVPGASLSIGKYALVRK